MSSNRRLPNNPVSLTISGLDGGVIVRVVPARRHMMLGPDSSDWRYPLPWYWTDDLARALVADGRIDEIVASIMIASPMAYRREETSVEAAAQGLLDDDEIPLLALAA